MLESNPTADCLQARTARALVLGPGTKRARETACAVFGAGWLRRVACLSPNNCPRTIQTLGATMHRVQCWGLADEAKGIGSGDREKGGDPGSFDTQVSRPGLQKCRPAGLMKLAQKALWYWLSGRLMEVAVADFLDAAAVGERVSPAKASRLGLADSTVRRQGRRR